MKQFADMVMVIVSCMLMIAITAGFAAMGAAAFYAPQW